MANNIIFCRNHGEIDEKLTSDLACSMEEAIASNADCPSINHCTVLPSSVEPLGGANEPKR